jgi:hypothetical protein
MTGKEFKAFIPDEATVYFCYLDGDCPEVDEADIEVDASGDVLLYVGDEYLSELDDEDEEDGEGEPEEVEIET